MTGRWFHLIFAALCAMSAVADAIPLPEHPRPDWERSEWMNLNGCWRFAFDGSDAGIGEKWYDAKDERFNKSIVVPFPWGSPLSKVSDDADVGWYRRDIKVPEAWKGKRIFLVVGASDWHTTGWIDGKKLGSHSGGYTPFEFELTDRVAWGKVQKITFRVWDQSITGLFKGPWRGPYHDGDWRLSGKQKYGNVRGLWQTVYLEARGAEYLEKVHFTPDIDRGTVSAEISLAEPARRPIECRICFKPEDGVKEATAILKPGDMGAKVEIPVKGARLWSLEDPYLYEVLCELSPVDGKGASGPADKVKSYFGMRKIGTGRMPGTDFAYVTLNDRPVYLQLTLDQAYHPEGYYTFPSDASLKNEIMIAKNLGLNGVRVHVKCEAPRKLYWADRLGMLVMADVPNSWGPACEELFMEHWRCAEGMISRDFNHPSVFSWVLFNESWGLFEDAEANGRSRHERYAPWIRREVAKAYAKAKRLDPTRLVEDNSNNSKDHVATDLITWHEYAPFHRWESAVKRYCDTAFPGSTEYFIGGFVQGDGPVMNSECGSMWAYRGSTGGCDWSWDYHAMINAFRRNLKCCGWIFTEHHDIIGVASASDGYVCADRTPKETGIEELTGGEMSLNDFHADAFIPLDAKLCREFKAGATWTVPVDASFVTDRYAGKKLALESRLIYNDGAGRRRETPYRRETAFTAKSWHTGRIAEVPVGLPEDTACGVVLFRLVDEADGKAAAVARNFLCFVTRAGRGDARASASVSAGTFSNAQWSQKRWNVMGGRKACGAGRGYFEYVFDVPEGASGAVFRAEVSSKRLNMKDAKGNKALESIVRENDCGAMSGLVERTGNPNSYPMTCSAKWPGEVKVYANGVLVRTVKLPDDPADHRGILSWMAQKHDGKLRDAGSYGYLVEAVVPADILRKGGGKATIRLESVRESGLAVYGAGFGRYPFDPTLDFRADASGGQGR